MKRSSNTEVPGRVHSELYERKLSKKGEEINKHPFFGHYKSVEYYK